MTAIAVGIRAVAALAILVAAGCTSAHAQGDEAELRKKAQNPIANLYTVPIETTFDFGAANGDATFIQLQPVIPIDAGPILVVSRTILPLIDAPGGLTGQPGNPEPVAGSREFGIGDITQSIFLSPCAAGPVIWGAGPVIVFPSASADVLGSGKWSMGPTAVVLTQPAPWSLGLLAGNVWSFAGDADRDSINQLFLQPFVSYNLPDGWFLTTAPQVTANWRAAADNAWVVPVGGGGGKLFTIGPQPMNVMLQSFYNAERPRGAPDWTLRFTLQLLFPR
jgi:hypothetical protein